MENVPTKRSDHLQEFSLLLVGDKLSRLINPKVKVSSHDLCLWRQQVEKSEQRNFQVPVAMSIECS